MPRAHLHDRVGGAVRSVRDAVLAPPRWWRELILIGVVFGIYRWVQTIVRVDPGPAYRRGWDLLRAQQALGIDVEHPLNAFLAARPPLALAANYSYVICHGAVTCLMLVGLCWKAPRAYPVARLSLAIITVGAFVVFALAPTAPPRLLHDAGFVDTLSRWHTIGGYQSGMVASTADQFAAMPSLHIAWAVWAAVWFAREVRRTWAWLAAVAYPVLVSLVILATANHYVLDIAGGLAIAVAGEALATAVAHVPGRRRTGAAPGPRREETSRAA